MAHHQRSRNGERTTAFEQALLASAESTLDSRGLLLECARRIGADAFALMLDLLGGGTQHMPRRRDFFDALAREERNARIFALLDAGRRPVEIAELLGIPEATVRTVINRAPSKPCNAES